MAAKPMTGAGYEDVSTRLVKSACLYIATKLGDLLNEIVIVGGLVPGLIVSQAGGPRGAPVHVGTMDLDVGLAIALLSDERYQELSKRLRSAGFEPDVNAKGNKTKQRWRIKEGGNTVVVDFLMPETGSGDQGGKIKNLEQDFAAVVIPGLELAFEDQEAVVLEGMTIKNEHATRTVRVCGAGAFVVLKALAIGSRGENKDVYDLVYVLRYFGKGVQDVFERLAPLLKHPRAGQALEVLKRDFGSMQGLGPRRYAEFLGDRNDVDAQADALGAVQELLRLCGEKRG
jgi:hypothetical protein